MRALILSSTLIVVALFESGCGLGGPCGLLSGRCTSEVPGGGSGGGSDAGTSKLAFVTSATYSGDLKTAGAAADGLAGGDALCETAARAQNLGGTWRAWLSAGNTTALSRIADVGPWKLVGGAIVFNNAAGLATTPLSALERDEAGRLVPSADYVFTGTESGGNTVGGDCAGWTSASAYDQATFGYVGSTDSEWTSSRTGKTACSGAGHLFCLEQ